MDKKIIMAYAALLLMPLFFTGCAAGSPQGILQTSDAEVGFFTEEVEIEKTKTISAVYTEDEIHFDETFILKEGGNTYELILTDVKVEPAVVSGRKVVLSYSKAFVDVEESAVPKEIEVTYYDDGRKPTDDVVMLSDANGTVQKPVSDTPVPDAQQPVDGDETPGNGADEAVLTPGKYTLSLKSVTPGEPVWVDYSACMTFADYGSAYYKLSDGIYMPHSDSAPEVDGFEDAILSYLGLSPSAFTVSYAVWNGEPYTDSSGILCRDAVLFGQRLTNSLKATYEGTAELPDVQGFKATATYYYRGVVRNVRKVRTAILAGIGVIAVLVTALLFLLAKKKRNRKENTAA